MNRINIAIAVLIGIAGVLSFALIFAIRQLAAVDSQPPANTQIEADRQLTITFAGQPVLHRFCVDGQLWILPQGTTTARRLPELDEQICSAPAVTR